MLVLFGLSWALAQDPPPAADLPDEDKRVVEDTPEADPNAPGMEVVITSQPVETARAELEQRLEDMGYERARRRGDVVIYTNPVAWKPRVLVHDNGFMVLRRQPPRVRAPNRPGSLVGDKPVLKWTPCILIPTLCVQVGGLFVSPARFDKQKELVVASTTDSMRGLTDAIAAESMMVRLNEEVPALLDSIWYGGVHPDTGQTLPTPESRRAAMLAFWESRADNEYGDSVRKVVELYMAYEVQESPWPFTPEEVAHVNETRHCLRALELPPPPLVGP